MLKHRKWCLQDQRPGFLMSKPVVVMGLMLHCLQVCQVSQAKDKSLGSGEGTVYYWTPFTHLFIFGSSSYSIYSHSDRLRTCFDQLWEGGYISFRSAKSLLCKYPWELLSILHSAPRWLGEWTLGRWQLEANGWVNISLFCSWNMFHKTPKNVTGSNIRCQKVVAYPAIYPCIVSLPCPDFFLLPHTTTPWDNFPNKLPTFLQACFLRKPGEDKILLSSAKILLCWWHLNDKMTQT